MLSQSTLNAAYPVAELLASKGWELKPVGETPLSQLINASLAQAQTLNGVNASQLETQPDFPGLLLSASTTADANGVIQHDQIMQSTVDAVSMAVTGNLSLARNIVVPLVNKVAEQVQTYVNGRSSGSLAPFSVVPFNYKAIWSSPILRELVGRYGEGSTIDAPVQALGLVAPAAIDAYVRTGVSRFDEEIGQFLADGAQGRLQIVWDRLFGSQAGRTLSEALVPTRTNIDDTLIGFLFARRVLEDIPDGVNMDPANWRAYVSGLMAQMGRGVLRILDRRELDKRNRALVIEMPSSNASEGEILVVGDNYAQWVAEGGTPEALFGSVLSDRAFGWNELITNAEQYKRVWKSEYTLRQSKIAADKFGYMVAGMGEAISQLIAETADDQLPVGKGELQQRLRDNLKNLKPKHLEDIYRATRKTVCRVMFPHTDAEAILDSIDAAAAAHPELELREAALLATISFVSRWVCKLFTVEVASDLGA